MKRILFFLATEKGYNVLYSLLKKGYRDSIYGIVSFHEIGMKKDYFFDIRELCKKNSVVFFVWDEIRNNLEELIVQQNITNCVAVSWRYLLPTSLNNNLDEPIIVFHDSLLPKYRGFAPIVTAMLCGEESIGATVLFASEEADCGDIILQKSFKINKNMYVEDVIHKMSDLYAELSEELIIRLEKGILNPMRQNHDEATYSIWRDDDDYWIDWKWPADFIIRFIRALGYPYQGAKTMINSDIIRIFKADVEPMDKVFAIRTPGKLWSVKDNTPIVICGDGMISIKSAQYDNGEDYKFTKLRSRMRSDNNSTLVPGENIFFY